jgi:CheY-like chemotaxis protein
MYVLCVDDDRVSSLLLAQTLLDVGGLTPTFAESGAEALALAREHPPDLLIIDLHLPDTDGLALLPGLRNAAGAPDLPAILCTAEPDHEVSPVACAAGFGHTWSKPVTAAQVRSTLHALRAAPAVDR